MIDHKAGHKVLGSFGISWVLLGGNPTPVVGDILGSLGFSWVLVGFSWVLVGLKAFAIGISVNLIGFTALAIGLSEEGLVEHRWP